MLKAPGSFVSHDLRHEFSYNEPNDALRHEFSYNEPSDALRHEFSYNEPLRPEMYDGALLILYGKQDEIEREKQNYEKVC